MFIMRRFWRPFWVFTIGAIISAVITVDTQITTTFSCSGRSSGYYADIDSGCQVYHMCDGLGRQFSYTCPNATLFQQRMLICDHWYMVNCSKSEQDYVYNVRIGQKEMPFVDDSDSNPYHRTPRPDLLSHPSQSEYDRIYRTGKAYISNGLNLVGIESDSKNKSTSTTDEPTYSLPSHWFTEYSQYHTTNKPEKHLNLVKKTENVDIVHGKSINNDVTELLPSSFKSFYKDVSTESSNVVVPPLPYQFLNKTSDNKIQSSTNFKSSFKATTPIYPTSVDIVSEEPSDVGILPPPTNNNTSLDLEIKLNLTTIKKNEETTESQLSKLNQSFIIEDESRSKKSGSKMLDNDEWAKLRKKYLIPDYEFPLESVSRPSYDSPLSSFQVSAGKQENMSK